MSANWVIIKNCKSWQIIVGQPWRRINTGVAMINNRNNPNGHPNIDINPNKCQAVFWLYALRVWCQCEHNPKSEGYCTRHYRMIQKQVGNGKS